MATSATEQTWLEAAQGRTAREVERLVSGHRVGDLPDGSRDAGAVRHVLRFEVSGEVLAVFREAVAQLRRESGGSLDDDAALLLMARQILAGSNEATRENGHASYQLAVTVCKACQRATQVGGGEAVDVPEPVLEMARCDAQVLTDTHVGAKPARAVQTIPPATRRAVLRRDRHRCQIPGCRHTAFVDVHHIVPRQDGGRHEPENLLTLCGAHHRACHRGDLIIEGSAGDARILHADRTVYGGSVSAAAADTQRKAFLALRALGFKDRETRSALVEATVHVGPRAGVEHIIRAALEHLSAPACAHQQNTVEPTRRWARAS